MKTKHILFAIALGGVVTTSAHAQQGNPEGGQRRGNPIIQALDLNSDGVIDSTELAKAVDSLKKLDKNGDGKLTAEEYRGQRPQGGAGNRPGRPEGDGQGGGNRNRRNQEKQ